MPADRIIKVPVMKAHQNIGDLYLGVMQAHDLFEIAKADRIRLESLEIPKYAGFQRALVRERVDEIRSYLGTPRSTFPNAIIISLDSEYISKWRDPEEADGLSVIEIEREQGAATIIDGQHRAAALDRAPEDFEVIVAIFVDLSIERSAEIFAKINSTQKAVNPSIAYQLFGYAQERSPQRTAHQVATTLNNTKGSPFYRKLRMLGTRDDWSIGSLSQATFSKELMKLYTRNFREDEYRILRGEKLEKYSGYPLRAWFINDEDRKILEVIWKFFFHVAETWPEQWTSEARDSILKKTTGYAAFIAVLKNWLLGPRTNEVLVDRGVKEAFESARSIYRRADRKFIRANYPAGNQGVILLRDRLLDDLRLTS